MSEYTPTTEKVRINYANDGLDEERLREEVYLLQQAKLEKEFDRWLAQHEAKVRDDYRERLVDALQDFNKELDVTDPFNNGFVTCVDQLIKVLDSVKERADDSFATIYR